MYSVQWNTPLSQHNAPWKKLFFLFFTSRISFIQQILFTIYKYHTRRYMGAFCLKNSTYVILDDHYSSLCSKGHLWALSAYKLTIKVMHSTYADHINLVMDIPAIKLRKNSDTLSEQRLFYMNSVPANERSLVKWVLAMLRVWWITPRCPGLSLDTVLSG